MTNECVSRTAREAGLAVSSAAGRPNATLGSRYLLAILIAGVVLRLWQYAADTSLWLDEIKLAEHILSRPLAALLLKPLPSQAAPQGFLLIEKLAVSALGDDEHVLRLLPQACALVSLFLFCQVALRALRGPAVPFAVALFAMGIPFIVFGCRAKQYAGDVAAALFLTWLTLDLGSDATRRRYLLTGLAGLVIVGFSHAAVLSLAGLGAALATHLLLERRRRLPDGFAIMCVLWSLAVAAGTLAGIRGIADQTRRGLHSYWESGFMPLPPRNLTDVLWLWERSRDVYASDTLQYVWPSLYTMLAVFGLWSLLGRRRLAGLILLGPIVVTIGAAAAHVYPFQDRLILFLVPSFILAVAAAAEELRVWWTARSALAGAAVMALLVCPPVYALVANPPVYRQEDMKPVLAHVQERRQPGDRVYVFHGAARVLRFYGPRYGFEPGTYVLGACHREDPRASLREVDQFRGQPRVWVLFTHVRARFKEEEILISYLDRIGMRRDQLIVAGPGPRARTRGAAAYLYDLTDGRRLASSSAETHPLPDLPPLGPLDRCSNAPARRGSDPHAAIVRGFPSHAR
jgi:hypothetical protein